jgi:hypothetical protein
MGLATEPSENFEIFSDGSVVSVAKITPVYFPITFQNEVDARLAFG